MFKGIALSCYDIEDLKLKYDDMTAAWLFEHDLKIIEDPESNCIGQISSDFRPRTPLFCQDALEADERLTGLWVPIQFHLTYGQKKELRP